MQSAQPLIMKSGVSLSKVFNILGRAVLAGVIGSTALATFWR
jgi:hypothetical protein